ncbi:MAG: hypothetical protein WCK67_08715 [bacterium]
MINNSLNVRFAGLNRYEAVKTSKPVVQESKPEFQQNSAKTNPVAFKGWLNAVSFQAKLDNPQDKAMYSQISEFIGKENQAKFDNLLKTGKLLSNKSNDGSSTLQNLHKIMTTPRADGLDNKKVLIETIKTIENPMIINQNFGKIPDLETPSILANEWFTTFNKGMGFNSKLAPHFNDAKYTGPFIAVTKEDMNVEYSGTCVASSIEFNLADRKPAEFTRLVASLSAPEMTAEINLKYNDIAKNKLEAVETLNSFGMDHSSVDFDTVKVKIRPDKNALVRAKIQQNRPDNNTRSLVDTIMQSTFMQLGSANTYNTLLDKRNDDFITDGKGLAQFEVNTVENIVDNDVDGAVDNVSVVYQNVDDTGKVTSYNYDYNTTKKQIIDTLNSDKNVIMGITELDKNNQIVGNSGHEITIIKAEEGKDGKTTFIGSDSDDNYIGAISIKEEDLIPKIHHAELSAKALPKDNTKPQGYVLLDEFMKLNNNNVKAN